MSFCFAIVAMSSIGTDLAALYLRHGGFLPRSIHRGLFRSNFRERLSFSPFQVARFSTNNSNDDLLRISKLISQYASNISISRRETERLIRSGEVTLAGRQITSPHFQVSLKDSMNAIKVSGKLVNIVKTAKEMPRTRVWIVHKLPGEIVSEQDPQGRPSLLDRLRRGGVGSKSDHLNAIGRLDMSTEGLILVTNNGSYKREMELPTNEFHRVYRVRVHGELKPYKLKAMRAGITIDGTRYNGMLVELETARGSSSTNNWMRLTCSEGKNRQIRKVLNHLGLKVTRLIRISYGDYELKTIPPGMALEVPVKDLLGHRRRGSLEQRKQFRPKESKDIGEVAASPVKWIKSF